MGYFLVPCWWDLLFFLIFFSLETLWLGPQKDRPGALVQTSTKTAKDFGSTWRNTTSRLLARIRHRWEPRGLTSSGMFSWCCWLKYSRKACKGGRPSGMKSTFPDFQVGDIPFYPRHQTYQSFWWFNSFFFGGETNCCNFWRKNPTQSGWTFSINILLVSMIICCWISH